MSCTQRPSNEKHVKRNNVSQQNVKKISAVMIKLALFFLSEYYTFPNYYFGQNQIKNKSEKSVNIYLFCKYIWIGESKRGIFFWMKLKFILESFRKGYVWVWIGSVWWKLSKNSVLQNIGLSICPYIQWTRRIFGQQFLFLF